MIILEILFYLGLIALAIYFAFFSKFAQRATNAAKERNASLNNGDTTEALASRVQANEKAKADTSAAIAARKTRLSTRPPIQFRATHRAQWV